MGAPQVVRLPERPGCVPVLGLPFMIAAPIATAATVWDALHHGSAWPMEAMAAFVFAVVGAWGVFARHAFEVDLAQGIVRSGTGIFRPRMRNARELGLPLKLEIVPFKVRTRAGIQTAQMVMLSGPRGRVKLDDHPTLQGAREQASELAERLGLSAPTPPN